MNPKWLAPLTVLASFLWCGCTSNPKPRPPRPPPRPTTRPVDWPETFPSAPPVTRPAFHVSEMRIESLEPRLVFYVRETVTYAKFKPVVEQALEDLRAAADEGRVRFDGPPVLRYLGATADLNKPFVVEVGCPAAGEPKPFGRFRVRRDPAPFRCAAVTFTGPVSLIDKAYDKLIPAMEQAGLKHTDEVREVYHRWVGPDAPDNEVLVGIGIR